MSFKIKYTDEIEKDIKKLNKEGYDISELKDIVDILEKETIYHPNTARTN